MKYKLIFKTGKEIVITGFGILDALTKNNLYNSNSIEKIIALPK